MTKVNKLNKQECEAFASQILVAIGTIVDTNYEELVNSKKVQKALKEIKNHPDYVEMHRLETIRIDNLKEIIEINKKYNAKSDYHFYQLTDTIEEKLKEEILKELNVKKAQPYQSSSSIRRYVTLKMFTKDDIDRYEEIAQDIVNGKIEINKY